MSAPPAPGRAWRPIRTPVPPRGPVPPVPPVPVSSTDPERLRENLAPVLAGLRWPAHRWQVLAEAEAWGVSGVVRQELLPLPDGRYPSFEAVVEVLLAASRGRLRPAPPRPALGAGRPHPAERAGVPPRLPRAVGGPATGPGHRPA
ncbi:hypothetical protein [Pseudonocardia sp. ICBG1293]|uniref:DUF2795 domain-containing protein n=1 Tax=Pseudonocardia sp. ICBG1293 TaxID=2844382 RepID=UPI001CCA6CBC|nr:hypothetical protein [Pseudonocardia sp. ICBG1293]